MQKRWSFPILALVLFLLSLSISIAGPVDKWIKCQNICDSDNACTPTGSADKCCRYNQVKNTQVCCKQGGGTWIAACTCTDADGDGYIEQGTDIATCGNACGNDGKQPCIGNNDCDDNNLNIHPGVSENTNALCSDGIDNNCNKNNDNSWDNDPNTGKNCQDLSCAGLSGPGGVTCCQTATITSNCLQSDCVDEKCLSNACNYDTKRNQCDTAECLPKYGVGYYCDALGGTCKTPDESSVVCLNCATDTTAQTWTSIKHQDAGKGFNSNLFNSNGGVCPASSCSDNNAIACACYTSTGASVNHKSSLGTGTCCGNNPNEYYKPDYYGPECTNDVNDCIWSTGDAQASNTGNKEYWCYMHEWNECVQNSDIGKKTGGVTCAGTTSNKKWTPNPQVLPENQYSCTDGFDNDGDTKIDCADTDCDSNVACTASHCSVSSIHSVLDSGTGNFRHYYSITWNVENCATKLSTDSDGSSTAYTTAGTVTDYLTCSGGSCTSNSHPDSCSINTLTEYAASSNTYTSSTKNCEDYEGSYCLSDRSYRQEWGCSGTPSYCNDAVVADTLAGTNSDGDAKDKECGDSQCDNAAGIYDSTKASTEVSCTDNLDNDCDGTTDCADSDCGTTVSGVVRNEDESPISPSKVDILKNGIFKFTGSTGPSGSYTINSGCGTYDIVASATDYISSTKDRVIFPPGGSITQDFTLFVGTSCEADCTYAGDNTIHQECEGINGCKFCPDGCSNPSCTTSIAQQSCNLAQPGWDRLYTDSSQSECENGCMITCQESCPLAKVETKAKVTCDAGENLIKVTKLVMYKGKLSKLNVVVCG